MKKILQHITCFWMVTLFGIPLLLVGCVKKEVTRHSGLGRPILQTSTSRMPNTDGLSDIKGGYSIPLTGARIGKNRR